MDLRSRWLQTWKELGAAPAAGLFDELISRYSEPHRRYHSVRHLEECFAKLDEVRSLAEHPGEIELALWFHDAIYDTHRQDNEARSADWARSSLLDAGGSGIAGDRFHALVLITRHAALPQGTDAQILVDVDLSILGANAERFDEYEQQIREAYRWVPEFVFRRKRKAILEEFLARPTIFNTRHFIERYEQQARSNLPRSLQRLSAA